MTPAKKKKVYVGIVVAGLGAIIVDRLIGYDTPASAAAAMLAKAPTPRRPAAPAPAEAGLGGNLETTPFPDFATIGAPTTERDPFAAPRELFEVQAASKAAGAAPPPRAHAADFPEKHTLSAVLNIGGTRYAVLDGTLLSVGQSFDSCGLMEIAAHSIRVRCVDGDATLKLDEPVLRRADR